MAEQVIKMKIQLRRGTAAEWELSKDVVPAAGEPCFVIDKNILKIGDGETTFEKLEPINGSNFKIDTDGKSIVIEEGIAKLAGFDAASVGASPRKSADGSIEWVIPVSTETITTIQDKVSVLENDVEFLRDILVPDVEGASTLEERVVALESEMDSMDGYVQSIVNNKVTEQINDFASKMSDDETVNTFKELVDYVANHGGEVATIAADVSSLQQLVGEDSVKDQITHALSAGGFVKEDALESIQSIVDEFPGLYASKNEVKAISKHIDYEIAYKPEGAIVDYRDKEIRVMCPVDTKWTKQSVGPTGNANMYYMGFKAYAPEGAVGFKEGDRGVIIDEMHDFNGDFAGTDEFGRNYSICWLALASYDEKNDAWTYYGKNSNTRKYIGWDYVVEWYDANGIVIHSDHIRINLSNESCHNAIESYYGGKTLREIAVNGNLIEVSEGRANITIEDTLCVKGSDEIKVSEDGTLSIGTISINKIVQATNEVIVLDGGSSIQDAE